MLNISIKTTLVEQVTQRFRGGGGYCLHWTFLARSNHFLMDTTYLINIAHTSVVYHCIGSSMSYQNTYPKVFQLED